MFVHCRPSASQLSNAVFLCFESIWTYRSKSLAINNRALMLSELLSFSHWTTCSLLDTVCSILKTRQKRSTVPAVSGHHQRSNSRQSDFPAIHPMSCLMENLEWVLFWHIAFHSWFNVMTINRISTNTPHVIFDVNVIRWLLLFCWIRSVRFSLKIIVLLFSLIVSTQDVDGWADLLICSCHLNCTSACWNMNLSPCFGTRASCALSLRA